MHPTSLSIVSGGQTGVDRAALDSALELGISCQGWCPRGRKAEDGVIPARYPLQETPSSSYSQRTGWNVRDSEGTLILTLDGTLKGGTALTRRLAIRLRKPNLCVDLNSPGSTGDCLEWLRSHDVRTLNVAGPRESEEPGIHDLARKYLGDLFRIWMAWA